MNQQEMARAAKRLRDDDAFQMVITEIEADLTRSFLNDATAEEGVAEARRVVAGLAAIQRKIRALIDAPKTAGNKKGQHRGSD